MLISLTFYEDKVRRDVSVSPLIPGISLSPNGPKNNNNNKNSSSSSLLFLIGRQSSSKLPTGPVVSRRTSRNLGPFGRSLTGRSSRGFRL